MKYIFVTKDDREFISGIFADRAAADAYLLLLSDYVRENTKIAEVSLEYPFFLAEDERSFLFHSRESILKEIEQYTSEMNQRDDEWCYTNLYRITEDYQPKVPGTDYMGSLRHIHVDNNTLRSIARWGFDRLW